MGRAVKWLKKDGLIHIEVPDANWLISKLVNYYYKVTFAGYVTNISPMHPPYHLYEFSKESFRKNGEINNYFVADYGFYVCDTFMPGVLDKLCRLYMDKTKLVCNYVSG